MEKDGVQFPQRGDGLEDGPREEVEGNEIRAGTDAWP